MQVVARDKVHLEVEYLQELLLSRQDLFLCESTVGDFLGDDLGV